MSELIRKDDELLRDSQAPETDVRLPIRHRVRW